MKTLIIYDSFFGSTEKIAQAIGGALGNSTDVAVRRVSDAALDQLKGAELLIAGSPTRMFSPSPAIKAFLKSIPGKSLEGVRVAAFDTRLALSEKVTPILRFMGNIFGFAAKPLLDILKKKGGVEALPPEGFLVVDTEGPLAEGELERAAEWGRKLKKG